MLNPRPMVIAGVLAAAATLAACGSNDTGADPTAPTANATSVQPAATSSNGTTPVSGASPTAPDVTPQPTTTNIEDAVRIMNSMYYSNGQLNQGAVVSASHNGNAGLVPVLVEAASRTFEADLALEIANALERLTGERVGGDFVLVAPWYTWLGNQPEFEELPGYDEWKGDFYSRVDPGFKEFFHEGVQKRIPLWTVQWGGVAKDGIPPLEMPQVLHADVATYLLPDEPVFGVVVNGEARAYPHRIMGWHEMANDVLGGKPISVVF